jgi:hypothetical protein
VASLCSVSLIEDYQEYDFDGESGLECVYV